MKFKKHTIFALSIAFLLGGGLITSCNPDEPNPNPNPGPVLTDKYEIVLNGATSRSIELDNRLMSLLAYIRTMLKIQA